MRHRYLACIGRLAAGVAVVWLAAVPIAGQTAAKAKTAANTPFSTPWGEPDLQGIWTNETITPLERPKELAGKQVLTAEEAAALERRAAQNRTDRAPRDGDPGTYNQFWMDGGTKVVGTRRTSLIIDPPDGRIPPFTPEAKKVRGTARPGDPFDSWVDLDTGERCLTDGLVMVPLQGYNMNYQIVQSPGYVTIFHEMFHDHRIIPTDGRAHIGQNIRQWLGDPRGHWTGNTLVVDTTNFADKTPYRWAAPWRASRETLHLVERFTRVDADTIDYQFTIDDPTTFTRPWTAAVPLSKNQAARGVTSGRLYEYACHEGNYAIVNILSGTRAQDKAVAEAAKKGAR